MSFLPQTAIEHNKTASHEHKTKNLFSIPEVLSISPGLFTLLTQERINGFMLHTIIWTLIIILIVFWVLGLALRIGRFFIHILLVLALILLLINLVGHF